MILDIIVIAVIAAMCIAGARRGIIKMTVHLCSWILSTVLAWLFYSPVAKFLNSTPIAEYIREAVKTGFVEPRMNESLSSVPELFRGMFESGMSSGAEAVAAGIGSVIIAIIAFILTLVLCRVLIFVIGAAAGAAARLPVIKQCNKLLGGILGVAEGVLILYIIAALVFAAAPLRNSQFFEKQLPQSHIASQIYNNNFAVKFIGIR